MRLVKTVVGAAALAAITAVTPTVADAASAAGVAHWQSASGHINPAWPRVSRDFPRTKSQAGPVEIYLSSTTGNVRVCFLLVYRNGQQLLPGNTGACTGPGGSRSHPTFINSGVPAGTSFRVVAYSKGHSGTWVGEMYY